LIVRRIREHVDNTLQFANIEAGKFTFDDFEKRVIPLVWAFGRLLVALFLCRRHETLPTKASEVIDGKRYERRQPGRRTFGTVFGKVVYWRTYMFCKGGGYHPLDRTLRLPSDRFSLHLAGLMTRIATKMSYLQSQLVLRCFLGWSPSTTTIEETVLGLGSRTQAFFAQAAVPENDGDVLVIELDCKATPTATDSELEKRRGERKPNPFPDSARHRGRAKRRQRGPKKRRKKGDKSKNGRATTVVTMYTLRQGFDDEGRPMLKGPINKRVYASYAPKRHVFAMARRFADQRGFTEASGKKIQVVVDGDPVLEDLVEEFFPSAELTLDYIHAVEYVWKAGRALHREGTAALKEWVKAHEALLYAGKAAKLVKKLRVLLAGIPKTGPGNKGKRKRLAKSTKYLAARVHMMNYKKLRDEDLVTASGCVEGAVRHVVAERFDNTGMRWIRERAEPLLQLRCIEINDQWDEFLAFVQATGTGAKDTPLGGVPLHAATPLPLPTFGLEAAG
jgi:hypothetical protein